MTSSRLISTLALGLAASIALTGAQDVTTTVEPEPEPEMCSCSPTVFTFVLSLDQSCEDNDIELNTGIDGSFCFTEEGVTLPEPPVVEAEAEVDVDTTMEVDVVAAEEPMSKENDMCAFCPGGLVNPDTVLADPNTGMTATCTEASEVAAVTAADSEECKMFTLGETICCPTAEVETEVEPVRRHRRTQHKHFHRMPTEIQDAATGEFVERSLQEDAAADPVTEIVSVQFLEFDTSGDLTVINQDDTYADVSLADGDRIKFYSASSFLDTNKTLADQMSNPALVPGGASLILYGKTASGTVVRNRFFWMYDMKCRRRSEPIKVDDEIGWVTVAEISNAWPAFCTALPEDSPTISPRTNDPTLTPSESPTPPPTTSPAMSMRPTPPPVMHHTAFSKSSKTAKTQKPGKASKSKSSKSVKSSKSSKSTKSEKSSSSVDGKTGKEHAEGAYANERVSKFDAERVNNGAIGSSSRWVGVSVMSLVASLLLARQ